MNEEDFIESNPHEEDETNPTGGNTSSDGEDYEYGNEQRPNIGLVDANNEEESSSDSEEDEPH